MVTSAAWREIESRGGHMHNLTIRRRRRGRHRVLPYDLPTGFMSTRLDRGSIVPLCVICIEAGRATEATFQTWDRLCGCDQHILELEQYGRAAIHRERKRLAAHAFEAR